LGIKPVADFETQNYQIMTDLNTSTEAPNTTETAIGFIPCYRLPFLSLFHADCMVIMKQYPDKYFDLAIVDPPYGINIAEWDKLDDRPKKEYWSELFRISKNQLCFGGNFFVDYLPITESWICWDKTIRGKTYLTGRANFELIWTSFKIKSKMLYYTLDGNIEGFSPKVDYNKKKSIHPASKPSAIYEWILKEFATEGMNILDTHFGSGSIALAVDKANRLDKMNLHLTACEIDKEYIDKAIKRISESIKQGTLSF